MCRELIAQLEQDAVVLAKRDDPASVRALHETRLELEHLRRLNVAIRQYDVPDCEVSPA
jgi:hypothetical protein